MKYITAVGTATVKVLLHQRYRRGSAIVDGREPPPLEVSRIIKVSNSKYIQRLGFHIMKAARARNTIAGLAATLTTVLLGFLIDNKLTPVIMVSSSISMCL